MDLLDNYKKAWDNQPEEKNKVSSIEIYKMAQSKSSSIVKWIFIIGILEFVFWFGINFFIPKSALDVYREINLYNFIIGVQILHYVVIILFLWLFYKNYSSISVIDSTKTLIKKILNVRKTVKYYVYYNVFGFILLSIIVNIVMFSNSNSLTKLTFPDGLPAGFSEEKFFYVMLISQLIFLILVVIVMLALYWLLYGILLKKLNLNYKELAKLDSIN